MPLGPNYHKQPIHGIGHVEYNTTIFGYLSADFEVTPDGDGDGSSWENATFSLQDVINKTYAPDHVIWVKEGVYGNAYHENAFSIPRWCRMYGGFKGDEPFDYDLDQRDFAAHPTILDGSHTQRVLFENDLFIETTTTIIDGFTTQNGEAQNGAGLLLKNKTLLKNCIIRNNHASNMGGGIQCLGVSSSNFIKIVDCDIYGYSAWEKPTCTIIQLR